MGLNDYPYHSINPFLTGVVESIAPAKTRKVAGFKFQDVINTETGEIDTQTMMVLSTRKEVDKAEFAKVFRHQFQCFFGLSKASLDILDYISDNIRYNHDRIALMIADLSEQKGISISTVYRSLYQLIENKLIAKADKVGIYYINPQIFFKGDRIVLINEYIKKEQKAAPIKKVKKEMLNKVPKLKTERRNDAAQRTTDH